MKQVVILSSKSRGGLTRERGITIYVSSGLEVCTNVLT